MSWPIDRGADGPGWEEVRHSRATGWDSVGRATWLTVKPWYWRFMPVYVSFEMRPEIHNTPFADSHGEATTVPIARAVVMWPKPAHLLIRWSMHPTAGVARWLHGLLVQQGHSAHDGAICKHPFLMWYYWLADNVYECRWTTSPTITVHYA